MVGPRKWGATIEAANEESSCEEGSGEEAAKVDLASHATPSGCGEKFPLGTIARPQSRPIATWTAPRQRYVPCGIRHTNQAAPLLGAQGQIV